MFIEVIMVPEEIIGSTIEEDQKIYLLRKWRNNELQNTDYTQLEDSPVNKDTWATYRQQLRDIFQQNVEIDEISIPSAPSITVEEVVEEEEVVEDTMSWIPEPWPEGVTDVSQLPPYVEPEEIEEVVEEEVIEDTMSWIPEPWPEGVTDVSELPPDVEPEE